MKSRPAVDAPGERWPAIFERNTWNPGRTSRGKIYGRLDCRAALQAIARGGYVNNRVFFRR